MNRLTIIGNLTKDPEMMTTNSGKNVCHFSVAVNRRLTAQQKQNNQRPDADFFRVSAWNALGENCQKYLAKGKKVSVVGPVSIHVYSDTNGNPAGSLEIQAEEVEFLTPSGEQGGKQQEQTDSSGYTQVSNDELPF